MTYHADTSAAALIAVTSILLGLGVIAVSLRFYARFRQKVRIGADDWLTLPALATFIAASACALFSVHLKTLGYNTGDLSKQYLKKHLEATERASLGLSLSSVPCLAASKASILCFYRRSFCVSGRNKVLNSAIIVSLILVTAWMVTYLFLLAFQCHTHFSAPWDGTILKYCDYSYPALESQAISDVLLDIWVLVLPIYPVLQLQTVASRKIAIIAVFLLACIGVGSSIARMVITIKLIHSKWSPDPVCTTIILGMVILTLPFTSWTKKDTRQQPGEAAFYWTLEMGVSVVAINLPSIWMAFSSVAPEKALRGVRSVISLESLSSKAPQDVGNGISEPDTTRPTTNVLGQSSTHPSRVPA